jgi:hypothetical protein
MSKAPDAGEARIHAEAIIAATLASAVMASNKNMAYTPELAMRQHKQILYLVQRANAFIPISPRE